MYFVFISFCFTMCDLWLISACPSLFFLFLSERFAKRDRMNFCFRVDFAAARCSVSFWAWVVMDSIDSHVQEIGSPLWATLSPSALIIHQMPTGLSIDCWVSHSSPGRFPSSKNKRRRVHCCCFNLFRSTIELRSRIGTVAKYIYYRFLA